MLITQKNQYALRAVYELARHRGRGLLKSADIAHAQAIPRRFVEVILSQLTRSGYVTSKRGQGGGYALVPPPDGLTVADILHSMNGSRRPFHCIACVSRCRCDFDDGCAFSPMWARIGQAIDDIYRETTLLDLMENETDLASPEAESAGGQGAAREDMSR